MLKRYSKLYIIYLRRAIKSRLEYKKDAIVGIISFLLNNLCSFITLMCIVTSIPSLNGWSMYELGLLYGFSMIPRALDHLFTDSLWYIGWWYVKNGLVDRYLIRPINVLFQVIAEVFSPEALGELILGIALIIMCGSKVTITITLANVLLIIVAVVFGSLTFTAIKLITCSVAFWAKRSGPLMNACYAFTDFARYPVTIYHPAIKFIMTYILPFGLVISVPIDTVLNGAYNPWGAMGMIILICSILSSFGYFLWVKGLAVYESSGS